MKDYPSIPRSSGQTFQEIPNALIFDKLDGSNMRSEWSRKQGWYKHGKRNGLIDDSNPHLVIVPELFMQRLAEPLARIAHDNRWQSLIVYYEFWGTKSVAGQHFDEPLTHKFLTVFDAVPDKKGFLGPVDFRRLFEDNVSCARYLGTYNFTRGFVDRVRTGEFEGPTFEGVVAKAGSGHKIVRGKAKTQKWIDRVIEIHGAEAAKRLIES